MEFIQNTPASCENMFKWRVSTLCLMRVGKQKREEMKVRLRSVVDAWQSREK